MTCRWRLRVRSVLPALTAAWLYGCANPAPPAPRPGPDVSGWATRTTQAIWHPGPGATEVVMDLQWWTSHQGECRLEVSKAGLPFISLSLTRRHWSLVGADGRPHSGHRPIPVRAGWLQLAQVLAGETPQPPWTWGPAEPGRFRLEHPTGKESWDVLFAP